VNGTPPNGTLLSGDHVNIFLRLTVLIIALATAACSGADKSRKQLTYHYQMGVSHYQEQNYTAALQQFMEVEQLAPDDPDNLYYLGMTYFYKKKYDLAAEKLLKAIELRSDFSRARNDLGVTYMELQRWDDAIRQLTIASEDLRFTEQESAGINLGLAYVGKGDTATAVTILRKRVAANPRNPWAHLYLGRAYFAGGKTVLAIGEYEEALRIAPDFAQGQYRLAVALESEKKYDAARHAYEQVIRLVPYSELGQLSKERLDALK
jgi:type IV pilus assembly protein PilF